MTFDTYAKGILTVIAALLAAQAVALLRPDPATAQAAAGGGLLIRLLQRPTQESACGS